MTDPVHTNPRRRFGLVNPVELFFGPVFQAEIRADGRRKRSYARASLYLLLLLAIVSLSFYSMRESASWQGGAASIQSVQELSPQIAMVLAWVQFLALGMLAPALAGGSLARERMGRTLPALLTTPMPASHIVFNKLAGSSFQTIQLILLGLPLLLAIRIFGGLPVGIILGFEVLTITTVLLGASLGIFSSLDAKRASGSIVGGIALLIATQFMPPVFIAIVTRYYNISPNPIILSSSSATVALGMLSADIFNPFGASGISITSIWLYASGVNLALAALILTITSCRLRRVLCKQLTPKPKLSRKERKAQKKAAKARRKPQTATDTVPSKGEIKEATKIREVSDHPLLWRELHSSLFQSR